MSSGIMAGTTRTLAVLAALNAVVGSVGADRNADINRQLSLAALPEEQLVERFPQETYAR